MEQGSVRDTGTVQLLRDIQRMDTKTCQRDEMLLLYGQRLQLLLLDSGPESHPASRLGVSKSRAEVGIVHSTAGA